MCSWVGDGRSPSPPYPVEIWDRYPDGYQIAPGTFKEGDGGEVGGGGEGRGGASPTEAGRMRGVTVWGRGGKGRGGAEVGWGGVRSVTFDLSVLC